MHIGQDGAYTECMHCSLCCGGGGGGSGGGGGGDWTQYCNLDLCDGSGICISGFYLGIIFGGEDGS